MVLRPVNLGFRACYFAAGRLGALKELSLDHLGFTQRTQEHKMQIWKSAATLLVAVAAGTSGAFAEVVVSEAWVRGMVKGQTDTGAFMTLKSTEAIQLMQVTSPIAKLVQIHEMSISAGMMMMRPVKALDIPANVPVMLKPGSYHVMLMGLDKPLSKGEFVTLQLIFRTKTGLKTMVDTQAEVRDLTQANQPMKMDGMNNSK